MQAAPAPRQQRRDRDLDDRRDAREARPVAAQDRPGPHPRRARSQPPGRTRAHPRPRAHAASESLDRLRRRRAHQDKYTWRERGNPVPPAQQTEPLRQALETLLRMPEERYTDEQWEALGAILELLPRAAAHLKLVFAERGETDFTEIAQGAVRALGTPDNPTDLLLALDTRIKHILVDEFQDTSYSQYELLEKLTSGWEPDDGRTLFLVGDPMQSIYRFREAKVALFLQAWERAWSRSRAGGRRARNASPSPPTSARRPASSTGTTPPSRTSCRARPTPPPAPCRTRPPRRITIRSPTPPRLGINHVIRKDEAARIVDLVRSRRPAPRPSSCATASRSPRSSPPSKPPASATARSRSSTSARSRSCRTSTPSRARSCTWATASPGSRSCARPGSPFRSTSCSNSPARRKTASRPSGS